jgi:hypothetical protein
MAKRQHIDMQMMALREEPSLRARGRGRRWLRPALLALAVFCVSFWANNAPSSETPTLTEYQVKALFLFNFAKYVDWPAEAFASDSDTTPITIGIVGENKFGSDLKNLVAGKSIGGRNIVIRQITTEDDCSKCHILFISGSAKQHWKAILALVKNKPVLTVGETPEFLEEGGIINFIKIDARIRLKINLDAARQAQLQISSKLLSVADIVRGKP